MCGRLTITSSKDEIEAHLKIKMPDDFVPSYNVAPTQNVVAVLNIDPAVGKIAKWGLVPSWSKDQSIGIRLFNARAETISEKPLFRSLFKKKRCFIVADGFFEWKKEGKSKRPYFIHLKGGEPFSFAGLWDEWKTPNGINLLTCTIITTTPNSMVGQLHDRMPVVLDNTTRALWLSESSDTSLLNSFMGPYDETKMEMYEVSKLCNKAGYDSPECIVPV